ncbi:hypothetical protein N7457_003515 [Penicillium paradoxum]|uniref:uncharacterized protein n=1 Tax=Penicillium paradoxum TaxID=176176 RepID=UPI0025468067|nr:uncharacterized protein N7457_003515 [Penicillium paradoxum]KAJ5788525.1 hypothetical protein N7457_003515 [Penicillium paradoxum]
MDVPCRMPPAEYPLAQELVEWLQEAVNYNDKIELCEFAYIHRNSVYIKQLAALASQDENGLDPAGRRSSFALVRHHILRLAHHIRAPTELVVDSYDLAHILHTYEVRGIDPFLGVPAPVRDSQTNLRGILNRMYRTTGEERKIVEDGLLYLDRTSNFMIFEHFMDQYEQSHPLVHAEVQVLELFHKGELSFAYGDRFVACSKPACLCCELYFKHHPARMVVPSSHRKVWTKWSPPLVKTFAKDDMVAREQTEIMNKIIQELRGQIIDQVLRRSQASRWHPDSKTCITETRSLGHFKSFGEQDIGDDSSSKSVANSLNTSESEAEVGVDQDVDSEDGGVCLFP